MTILPLIALLGAGMDPSAGAPGEARFKEGLEAYDAGDYRRAIEAFEESHRLSAKPQILFNIAQTYRVLGHCGRAVESFTAFIAAVPGDDPLVSRARARLQELGSCPGEDAVAAPEPPKAEPVRLAVAAPLTPAPDPRPEGLLLQASPPGESRSHPRSALRTTCIASAGASVALGGASLGLGLWARSTQSSIEGVMAWDTVAERTDERGRALGRAATTLLISAGVTVAVALTTCLLSSR